MKNKTKYYWSPFLTEIATVKAVINSAYSLRKILLMDAYADHISEKLHHHNLGNKEYFFLKTVFRTTMESMENTLFQSI